MLALKEFANLITLNMANLTGRYVQILVENKAGYEYFSGYSRKTSARKLLKAVIIACESQTATPLVHLFDHHLNDASRRWASDIDPPQPITEVEALGQTLMPVVPNLEASKFLWQILSEVRATINRETNGSTSLVPVPSENGRSEVIEGPRQIETVSPQHLEQAPEAKDIENEKLPRPRPLAEAEELLQELAHGSENEGPSSEALHVQKDDLIARNVPSIAKLEKIQLTMDSRLADLPVYDFQIEANTIVREVESVLRTHIILPGVIVTDQQVAIGVISRRKFFEQLGQLYGVSVYMRRPIRLVLEAIGSELLCLPATRTISEALELVLSRPPHFVYEPIVVEFEHQTYHLLDIYTLLSAQSKLFAHLQAELQVTNNELEERVERRTAQLVKVNADLTREIVKRKQVEEALILARDEALAASRLKSELVAKVSHELRTPLGSILGHTEMIQMELYGPISEEQKEATSKIIKSTNYLTGLVGQLLDQAQFEAGKLKLNISPFAPADMIEDALSKLSVIAQNKGLALTIDIAADVPPQLSGDKVRLEQILLNLVSNAIKFTEQGTVCVRLYCPDTTHWAIQVSDTGPGIPLEAQTYIFEPFEQVDGSITREHAGTGLGLSIVKQLTTLMDGQIDLESTVGQGSTFTIILPLQLIQEETC
jgi:signal transduction histidine kinase